MVRAEDDAPLVFEAERRVLLEPLTEAAPAGWAKVKHRDGQSGFVRISQVWGL
ncbi:MAG: SH3 domain-containing protein [Methyloversatilis sp.]|nr:SH3 domain-containing protein [Methyloversatilis sp.]